MEHTPAVREVTTLLQILLTIGRVIHEIRVLFAQRLVPLMAAGLALVAGGSAAQSGFTGQGIYPGTSPPEAFRLPYDFEPVIRPRMS
jgi:hypothetical protein